MSISQFIKQLSINNNREWFACHRQDYDFALSEWYDGLDQLIELVGDYEPRLKFAKPKDISYRIYRDTRFSSDKTPYKDHFSAILAPLGKKVDSAAYYIQVGTTRENTFIAGGAWCCETATIKKLRKAVVDNIEEFTEIITNPALTIVYPEWMDRSLKSAPKGWPKDHPHINLIKMLGYVRCHYVEPDMFDNPNWPVIINDLLKPLKPLNDFLNYSLTEE